MQAPPLARPTTLALAPLAAVAGPVALGAWLAAEQSGAALAVAAVLIAALLYAASELVLRLAAVGDPFTRLMVGMMVRGGGALACLLVTIAAGVDGMVDEKLVGLVASAVYLALVAGEVLIALKLQGAPLRAPQLQPTGEQD